jgi:hypothetical protein
MKTPGEEFVKMVAKEYLQEMVVRLYNRCVALEDRLEDIQKLASLPVKEDKDGQMP